VPVVKQHHKGIRKCTGQAGWRARQPDKGVPTPRQASPGCDVFCHASPCLVCFVTRHDNVHLAMSHFCCPCSQLTRYAVRLSSMQQTLLVGTGRDGNSLSRRIASTSCTCLKRAAASHGMSEADYCTITTNSSVTHHKSA
jgi:hypothetical protein